MKMQKDLARDLPSSPPRPTTSIQNDQISPKSRYRIIHVFLMFCLDDKTNQKTFIDLRFVFVHKRPPQMGKLQFCYIVCPSQELPKYILYMHQGVNDLKFQWVEFKLRQCDNNASKFRI